MKIGLLITASFVASVSSSLCPWHPTQSYGVLGPGGSSGPRNSLHAPHGVVGWRNIYTNTLFITDYGNHRLVRATAPPGEPYAYDYELGGTADRFDRKGILEHPLGIAITWGGELYVSSFSRNEVVIFDGQGLVVGILEDLEGPCHMYIDDDDSEIYIAEWDEHRVSVYDMRSRELVRTIGGPDIFNHPYR